MKQRPFSEANSFSTSQKIRRILRKPLVYNCVYKNQPLVHILSQINPDQDLTSCYIKAHLNIIYHLRLGLTSCLYPSRFPTKTLYEMFFSLYVPHSRSISSFLIF